MQIRIVCPSHSETSPLRRSRTFPTDFPDTRVTDAHPAAVGELEPLVLARDEDRLAPGGLGLGVRLGELDGPALALLAALAVGRLEALEVEHVRVAVLLPVLAQRVDELGGAGDEGEPLLPVRHALVEVLGLEAVVALAAGVVLLELVAVAAC